MYVCTYVRMYVMYSMCAVCVHCVQGMYAVYVCDVCAVCTCVRYCITYVYYCVAVIFTHILMYVHTVVEKHIVLLKDLIRDTLLLNDKMQGVLKLTKWESVEPVGELVGIYKTNPFQLDSGEELIKVHVQVSQWMQVYDTTTKVKGRLPTVQEAKTTLSQGLSLPVQLSCVLRLQDHLDSMKHWLSNVESSFLHAGSKSTLLEVRMCMYTLTCILMHMYSRCQKTP